MTKKEALARFLGVEPEEVTEAEWEHYGLEVFEVDGEEYAVGTDEEADEAVREAILGSLWAFRTEFIISHCDLPWELEEMIRTYQETKCEGANEAIRALIEACGNLDEFIEEAVETDGRGHFLATYDGIEEEEGEYYIYRL